MNFLRFPRNLFSQASLFGVFLLLSTYSHSCASFQTSEEDQGNATTREEYRPLLRSLLLAELASNDYGQVCTETRDILNEVLNDLDFGHVICLEEGILDAHLSSPAEAGEDLWHQQCLSGYNACIERLAIETAQGIFSLVPTDDFCPSWEDLKDCPVSLGDFYRCFEDTFTLFMAPLKGLESLTCPDFAGGAGLLRFTRVEEELFTTIHHFDPHQFPACARLVESCGFQF